jgi:hypothetical protein
MQEELRIALVMNGGVSLAVCIGGVTRENRTAHCARVCLRRASGAYGDHCFEWM